MYSEAIYDRSSQSLSKSRHSDRGRLPQELASQDREALRKEEEQARKKEETGSKPKNDNVAKKEEVELRTLTLSMKGVLRPKLTDMGRKVSRASCSIRSKEATAQRRAAHNQEKMELGAKGAM